MLKHALTALTVTIAFVCGPASAAAGESKSGDAAQAAKARNKPLQRCDQLKDKAELECLHKARERIIEARRKREASGKGNERALPAEGDKAGATKGTPSANQEKK